jgi:hypothetical protein
MAEALFKAGVAREIINPPPGVELAGLGYYLERTWLHIRDNLAATALAISENGQENGIIIIAVDMMYNDVVFTGRVRSLIGRATQLPPESICVNFSHSHNAPTAGLILGGGEQNPEYLEDAALRTARAGVAAWKNRQAAHLFVGQEEFRDMTFNRTREGGQVDRTVGVLRVDSAESRPIAAAVNFHSHCTAHMESDLRALSRDWPGEVVDRLEAELPGCTVLYLQGTCGDVNFKREYNGTERRFEPGRAISETALKALDRPREIQTPGITSRLSLVELPTRRWTREEINTDRQEGEYRLRTGDITGWLGGIARVCVNLPERLPLRYGGSVEKAVAAVSRFAVEWTDLILPELETRPEVIRTDVQALRIGDLFLAANPAELFTTEGLSVRSRCKRGSLFMLGYSNGSIGYLPDDYDIARRSYAAIQSAKFTGQFPFVAGAGQAMANGLLRALEGVTDTLPSSA